MSGVGTATAEPAGPDLAFADAQDQAAWLRAGGSSVSLVRTYLERIERLDPHLRSIITVTAERAEVELRAGHVRSPLHGIPFAVRDQMLVDGVRLTGG